MFRLCFWYVLGVLEGCLGSVWGMERGENEWWQGCSGLIPGWEWGVSAVLLVCFGYAGGVFRVCLGCVVDVSGGCFDRVAVVFRVFLTFREG